MAEGKFFTEIKIEKSKWQINHKDRIFLIGSCFTDEIGNKFEKHGFDILKNPFGTIYNPLSIANLIERCIKNEEFTEKDIIKSGEFYHPFATHGDIYGETIKDCLQLANKTTEKVHNYLQNTTVIIITLGTAWSYWHKNTNTLMANCHKIPQKEIKRRLLCIEEVNLALSSLIIEIQKKLPQIKHMLFTVSPVRHIKEGLYDNNLSKSTLHLSINNVITKNKNVDYFPSYEIVMDCLRDYRFYAKDLVHLNEMAVDYIWEKFSDCYFSDNTRGINEKYYKLVLMQNHRPIHPNSEGYKKHLEKIEKLQKELK